MGRSEGGGAMSVETDAASLLNGFAAWLDAAMNRKLPPELQAFSFNLYEAQGTWDMEITGAAAFDPANADWACDPLFSYPELFYMPRDIVGTEWEHALAVGIELVTIYLRGGKHREVLQSSLAIAIGFVDGDLTIVWPEMTA
jgi:hypothetical protein